MKKRAKKLWLAIITMSIAMINAVSGLFTVSTSLTASAAVSGTSFTQQDLFKTDGQITLDPMGTAIQSKDVLDQEGNVLEYGKPFTAQINGVFTGDTRFNFRMQNPMEELGNIQESSFAFRIADVENDDNYFDIVWVYAWKSGYGYPVYQPIVRYHKGDGEFLNRSHYKNSNKTIDSLLPNGEHMNFFPCYPDSGWSSFARLDMRWEGENNDVFTIYLMNKHTDTPANDGWRLFMKFDGTEAIDTETGAFGLPKISFENGYTITYLSSYKPFEIGGVTVNTSSRRQNAGVIINDIRTTDQGTLNDLSYNQMSLSLTPSDGVTDFFTKYQQTYTTKAVHFYNEKDQLINRKGEVVAESTLFSRYICLPEYHLVDETAVFAGWALNGNNEDLYPVGTKVDIPESGDLIFKAIIRKRIALQDMFVTSNTAYVQGTHAGASIISNALGEPYAAKYASLFKTDDVTFTFDFAGNLVADSIEYGCENYYCIRVTSVNNTNKYFDVVYRLQEAGEGFNVLVYYEDEIRFASGSKFGTQALDNDANALKASETKAKDIQLRFKWIDGIFTVQSITRYTGDFMTVAAFDGDDTKCGLPTLPEFAEGYFVTFISDCVYNSGLKQRTNGTFANEVTNVGINIKNVTCGSESLNFYSTHTFDTWVHQKFEELGDIDATLAPTVPTSVMIGNPITVTPNPTVQPTYSNITVTPNPTVPTYSNNNTASSTITLNTQQPKGVFTLTIIVSGIVTLVFIAFSLSWMKARKKNDK